MTRIDKENQAFIESYLNLFAGRFASSGVTLETYFEQIVDSGSPEHAFMFQDIMQAIRYILEFKEEKIRPDVILEVAKLIDGDVNGNGFRRTMVEVKGSNVLRSEPKQIYMDLYVLLDNYYNIWSYMQNQDGIDAVFLKEAQFHIRFLHIHPLEDGNGRTARIISATNLLKAGYSPFIVSVKEKERYNSLIENNDVEGMARLFQELSKKEDELSLRLYDKYQENKAKNPSPYDDEGVRIYPTPDIITGNQKKQ